MTIIIDKRVPHQEVYMEESLIQIDLDEIHGLDDSAEDRYLTIYKMIVENGADLVIIADTEVGKLLSDDDIAVCIAQ